jgi:uncharacterized membrane protein YccF (DUF307 family)
MDPSLKTMRDCEPADLAENFFRGACQVALAYQFFDIFLFIYIFSIALAKTYRIVRFASLNFRISVKTTVFNRKSVG